MEINLKNKTAWVFGGSRGIGQSIAVELAKAGANILLIARKKTALHKSQEMLCTKQQQQHDVLSIDMNNVESLIDTLKKYRNLNGVDILINNSGGPNGGLAHTAELEEYLSAFKQHLLAAQAATQIVLPVMKKKQFGRIINIISTSVKQPIPGLGVSNTIRGAVANWGKTLASEVGHFGVTVNNILPGATKTDRLNELLAKKANKYNCSEEEVAQKMKSGIPVGRFAEPQELGYLATFLCSDYASYINGINIPIDGGRTKSL
jgi:3-oxoacyl-[acyl-carrier protein] reductase